MNGYARGLHPETILHAKVAFDQVLYQVKWFGWHETGHYIESSVLRANDPHLIVEFYEDITIHPYVFFKITEFLSYCQSSVNGRKLYVLLKCYFIVYSTVTECSSDSLTLEDTKSFDGSLENRELLSIDQAIFDHTKIMYYTMWSGLDRPEWTDSRDLKEDCFDLIIDFWESRISQVINASKNDG